MTLSLLWSSSQSNLTEIFRNCDVLSASSKVYENVVTPLPANPVEIVGFQGVHIMVVNCGMW